MDEIKAIQKNARENDDLTRPKWPMIVLRTPKGWTGPKVVDGNQIEGSFRAHQVPIMMDKPEHLQMLKDWLLSYHPEEVLAKYEYADLVMVGEGERTFQEFMAYLVDGDREISSIDGIVYRGVGGLHRTKPRQGLDMDDLVYPYDDMETLKNRIIYYESMRGCPFSCSYCLSSIEKSVRIKSPEKTERELDFFLENKVPQVKFVDRTFNCNHAYAYRIWKYIGEHDNGVTNFHFEIGGDLLHEEDFLLFEYIPPGTCAV